MAKIYGNIKKTQGYTINQPIPDLSKMTQQVLSKEQCEIVDSIKQWHYYGSDSYKTLAGCAGTGKTFLIPYIVKALGLNFNEVALCAYTGKATKLLQRKDMPASTIHSLIYVPVEVEDENGELHIEFEKRKYIDGRIRLIIVDEASMVSSSIHRDLLAFGVPILYVGDYFQLPPIKDDFNLMMESNLDFKLTQIYRQAENNPIIKLSMDIRAGRRIPFGSYGDTVVKLRASQIEDSSYLAANQIICGKNVNRIALNNYLRELYGYRGLPKQNEKLIILRNNYSLGVVNGQQIILLEDAEKKNTTTLEMKYIDEYDTQDAVKLLLAERYEHKFSSFHFNPRRKKVKENEFKKMIEADFGYAITVHKAQGSEWENVIFYDDGFGRQDEVLRAKLLYTAVTRASERLIIAES